MSTEVAEQPVKRKSVADMWREREQAMLEKQQEPYKTASPPRRSLKSFEEKKVDGTEAVNTDHAAQTDAETSEASRRPVSTKSKFAMMGQKHAARPKKLPSYQQYQQPSKKNDPKPPDSADSDDLLGEAFDDAVAAQEGKKRFSDGADARASEYSSLQVSDSASIPKDVHRSANDNYDDASNISGLSSPGSPARTSRNQRRANAILETPERQGSFDSREEGSAGSTASPVEYPSNFPESLDDLSVAVSETLSEGLEAVTDGFNRATDAVVNEGFVEESETEASAFHNALQKISLEDIKNDIKEALLIDKIQNDLNESMASASQRISSLFARKEEEPAPAEKSLEDGETPVEGDAATTPVDAESTPETATEESTEVAAETVEPVGETVTEADEAAGVEVTETEEPASEEPEHESPAEAATETADPAAIETSKNALDEAKPIEGADDVANVPDPPLEIPESSEVFDPFAPAEPEDFANFADFSAFPDDAFGSDFAAPAPASKPVDPVLPKQESSPKKKPASSPSRRPAAQEEVAIEVEYLEDSDDDQADV